MYISCEISVMCESGNLEPESRNLESESGFESTLTYKAQNTVASLLSPVQEVSSSPNDITIEMHMHDGTEVGHCMGDNMK